ncbi:hypothetical protein NQ315_005778 [Exocentrus adspersus]|uniref:Actin-interacting protein 1 n=1 Tax=Exocentrus adspersus TaxID=1586481 RepID=A0AAV8VQV8_9CUCU|nr:hypothetical protein NQ315_005778 [Exocentrus adspersus]
MLYDIVDSNLFASAGFDGKVFLYDGTSSELIGEVGSPAHSGGVYGVAWSPDGKQLLTASGDKTAKLWDVDTRQVVSEFVLGNTVEDQQVSCLWQNNYLLTVSLSGFINYLDVNDPSKPIRVIKGHNKPITALTLSEDRSMIFTASHDGFITRWNAATGENERISGTGHGNQVNGMRVHNGIVYTCGIDDSLKQIDIEANAYKPDHLKLGSQPRGMDVLKEENIIVTASVNEITISKDNQKLSTVKVSYEPTSVSCSPRGHIAIGGNADNKVHIYELQNNNLNHLQELDHLGAVTDVAYSPDDKYLVACDAHRKVVLYSTEEYKLANKQEWGFHNARVNCVAWSPDSQLVASGSLDTSIIIWHVEKPAKHIIIKSRLGLRSCALSVGVNYCMKIRLGYHFASVTEPSKFWKHQRRNIHGLPKSVPFNLIIYILVPLVRQEQGPTPEPGLEWTPVQEVDKAKVAKATDSENAFLGAEMDCIAALKLKIILFEATSMIKKTTADREAPPSLQTCPSRWLVNAAYHHLDPAPESDTEILPEQRFPRACNYSQHSSFEDSMSHHVTARLSNQ